MNAPAQQFQMPAHLANLPKRQLAATTSANLGTATPPSLSIEGGRFTLVDGAGNEKPVNSTDPQLGYYIDVVIVDLLERVSKIYYERDYAGKQASATPPDCWSDNGIGPSRQAGNPQSPICANCPQAVWGSDTSKMTGKGIKACRDYQKAAILVPGMGDLAFLLRIPPNSLKNFRAYAEQFRGREFDMDSIVTRISFVQGVQGTLQFQPITWIDEGTAKLMGELLSKKATDGMIGRNDLPKEGVALPAARPSAQIEHQPAAQAPAAGPFGGGVPAQNAAEATPTGNPATTQNAPSNQPSSPAPTGRGRRRGAQAAADQPAATTQPAQAPFRPNPPPADTGFMPGSTAGSGSAPFGIQQNAQAPSADIARDLNSVFGK